MSRAYKFRDQESPYFVSFATVGWVDVFTRNRYREVVISSIKHCQQHKGLIVYAWCIMSNHVDLIIGTQDKPMESIIRDLKSFTSRHIRKELEANDQESRKEWMLSMFQRAGRYNSNNKDWQFWQQNNQPIELFNAEITMQKLEYLHNNPVEAGWVHSAEDFVWSSAKDYGGEKGLIDVVFLY